LMHQRAIMASIEELPCGHRRDEAAPWFQDPEELQSCPLRIFEMLQKVKTKDQVELGVLQWELVGVARHDPSVWRTLLGQFKSYRLQVHTDHIPAMA